MSKKTKIWLITATSLVLFGCVIFGGVMTILNWDFTKLSTVKYETDGYEINEYYKHISIVTKTADVLFVPSENSKTTVICHEPQNMKHLVTVQDGTLVIEVADTRQWYEYIGVNFGAPKITVYIPQGEVGSLLVKSSTGDVEIPKVFKFESIDISQITGSVINYASASKGIKLKTSTGNIRVETASANMLDLSVSTGEVIARSITCDGEMKVNVTTGKTNLSDIECKNFVSDGNTGEIFLKNMIAAETFYIKRSTGDVKFEGCDAAGIFVKTDTGAVSGSFLSDKVFLAESNTGRVNVPKTVTGGKCEIVTSTGDININIQQ